MSQQDAFSDFWKAALNSLAPDSAIECQTVNNPVYAKIQAPLFLESRLANKMSNPPPNHSVNRTALKL
jgi:hypothetical protein